MRLIDVWRTLALLCGLAVTVSVSATPLTPPLAPLSSPADAAEAAAENPLEVPAAAVLAADPDALPIESSALPDPALAAAVANDDARVRAFVDGVVDAFRQRDRIAGVAVAVVRNGRVVLEKGYGNAALDPARAVDPARDLFRIASISKTFTYIAAMQLVEQGKLSLDDPINQRLPEALIVPDDGFAEPIRVRHLFTHTAGFEDLAVGHLFVREPTPVLSQADYVIQHRPHRVRPPGAEAVYSNYSVALLGAIVANVSGERFEDYIERHIIGPLAMTSTTFREPGLSASDPRRLDGELAGRIATGFSRAAGTFKAQPFEHIAHTAPAGGASSTAADMARYALALLGDGSLDSGRVLKPETNAALREILFTNADGVNGIAHGFLTDRVGPHFVYGHGGATTQFHSNLALVPSLGLGIFITTNTDTGRRFAAEFPAELIEFLDPAAKPQPLAPYALDGEALARFAGDYLTDRRPYRSPDALLLTLDGAITSVAAVDGGLVVTSPIEALRFLPTGPQTFREIDGHRRIAFRLDADGRPRSLVAASGIGAATHVGFFQKPATVVLAILVAGAVAVASLVAAWRRRNKRPPTRPGSFGVKALAGIAAIAWLAFAALFIASLSEAAARSIEMLFLYPTALWRAMLIAAVIAAGVTVLELVALPVVWRSRWRGVSKLVYTAGVALLALTVFLMWRWNLLAGVA